MKLGMYQDLAVSVVDNISYWVAKHGGIGVTIDINS